MSLVEKYWMVTSKISVIALLMITGIYFGKFVCPYIKKKKGAVAVSIVYITIMLVLYMIPPQIDNFSAYLIGVISKYPLSDTVICKSLAKMPPFVTFTSSSCEQEEKLAIAAIKSADI